MLTKTKIIISTIFIITFVIGGVIFAGSISNPTDLVSTGYTIADIYNLIHGTGGASEGRHNLYPAVDTTATSSYSISQIYADLANLIKREDLATGTVYLGVTGDYGNPDPAYATTTVIATSKTPVVTVGGPLGYSLGDVWNLIDSNSTTTALAHDSTPASLPVSSMHSLTDIYNALEALASAKASEVKLDSVYLGVPGTYVPPPSGPSVAEIVNSLRSGLIGYWPGDNNVIDNSGNSNDVSWTIGSPTYTTGMFGQAFVFNGSSEVSLNMNNMPSQEVYSVSVWAKASQLNMRNGQMIGWGHDWDDDNFSLMIGGADSYGDVSSNQLMVLNGYWKATGYFLNDLDWHHFAATADGTTLRIYVDGVLVPNNLSVDGRMSPFVHLGHFPGGYYQNGQSGAPLLRYYYGSVDEAEIWNRTLSESEVLNLYNSGAGRSLVQ